MIARIYVGSKRKESIHSYGMPEEAGPMKRGTVRKFKWTELLAVVGVDGGRSLLVKDLNLLWISTAVFLHNGRNDRIDISPSFNHQIRYSINENFADHK